MRLLCGALAIALIACSAPARLSGTALDGGAAPDFTLTDGISGSAVTLSSLRGSVVVIAFLYTHCPDVCPITASKFRAAQTALGPDAARVRFVAVSVDPEGDTPNDVRAFSAAHDLSTNWVYLIGPRAQLEPVWKSYGVGAFASPMAGHGVDHNDAIYVLDANGRERELVHSDIAVNELVNDLRALLRG
ncbi:MAG TPA: SCO family protein [Candidatus Limnocylindria bacterium]|nr:SCO family protein [Candidatus Limnocylindria bacterium]